MNKNPGLAAVLSFLIPGLGQIYNGEIGKGFLIVGANVLSWILTVVFVGFILLPIVWGYAVYDAYKTASRLQQNNSQ